MSSSRHQYVIQKWQEGKSVMAHATVDPAQSVQSVAPSPAIAAETTSASRSSARKLAITRVQMLLLLGTVIFSVSHFFTWWELRLNAPQYPEGLFIQAASFEIQDSPKTPFDDIDQVDGLNHYIGMMSLGDAAELEMAVALPAIFVFVAMGIAAFALRRKWAPLLAIPIILFPFVYLADLAYWLWYAGHNLDPTAAITIDAFTPRVIGRGVIAQFSTDAGMRTGWYMALAAAILCAGAIVMNLMQRRRSS